jgi:hypothetical protein
VINSALYRDPQMLDSKQHRTKRLKVPDDYSVTKGMHAAFLTATEFPQACVETPIIFVRTGEQHEGKPMVSSVALLGLVASENLRVDSEGRWLGHYVPAFIRRYPFVSVQIEGAKSPSVFVDTAFEGFNDTEGERLFDDEGKPTDALKRVVEFLERFDQEQLRTSVFCQRLVDLDLLKEMTADATLPGGETLKIEGFLSVDEDKLGQLPDSVVMELHRSGMLMLIHAHLLSLTNIRELIQRKHFRLAEQKPGTVPQGAA